jgi:ABC-2 type transport system permease protein
LLAFFTQLLVMGWALGLMISALVLRLGMGAESLAWVGVFALAPLSGIYYPIATLPDWLQPVALALPSAHIFEGMRAVLIDGVFDTGHFMWSIALNVLYLASGAVAFLWSFQSARRRGALLQIGE